MGVFYAQFTFFVCVASFPVPQADLELSDISEDGIELPIPLPLTLPAYVALGFEPKAFCMLGNMQTE